MGNILRTLSDFMLRKEDLEEEATAILTGENIAEAMTSCCGSGLPGDVILHILSQLSVKSLLRFKCVCKIWKNVILSPAFINMHLNRKKPLSLLLHSNNERKTFIYKFPSETSGFNHDQLYLPYRLSCRTFIAGSSNGLICMGQFVRGLFILWNPATSKFRYLRLPSSYFCLKRFCTIDFGFVPTTGDYKVVSISSNKDEHIDVNTFTLSKNSWTTTRIVTDPPVVIDTTSVRVNGYLHWLGTRRDGFGDERVVVSFDMSEETFHQTQPPSPYLIKRRRVYRSLAVLNESLAMFIYPFTNSLSGECIEIWVTNYRCNSTTSWTIYSTIEPLSTSISIGIPIGFWLNGEEIIFTDSASAVLGWTSETTCNNTYLYYPRDGIVRNIPYFEGSFSRKIIPHLDTLVSVEGTS